MNEYVKVWMKSIEVKTDIHFEKLNLSEFFGDQVSLASRVLFRRIQVPQ